MSWTRRPIVLVGTSVAVTAALAACPSSAGEAGTPQPTAPPKAVVLATVWQPGGRYDLVRWRVGDIRARTVAPGVAAQLQAAGDTAFFSSSGGRMFTVAIAAGRPHPVRGVPPRAVIGGGIAAWAGKPCFATATAAARTLRVRLHGNLQAPLARAELRERAPALSAITPLAVSDSPPQVAFSIAWFDDSCGMMMGGNPEEDIYVASLQNGVVRRIEGRQTNGFGDAAFSPDGKRLAFVVDYGIDVADLASTRIQSLIPDCVGSAFDAELRWLDNTTLAFSAGCVQIMTGRIKTGRVTVRPAAVIGQIPAAVGTGHGPTIVLGSSRHGHYVAYGPQNAPDAIWIATIDGKRHWRIPLPHQLERRVEDISVAFMTRR